MRILLPLIAVLVPLVITPGLLFHFDSTPKQAILLYGTALAIVIWSRNWSGAPALWRNTLSRLYCCTLILQLLWLGLSTAMSLHRSLSLDGSEWRRLGLYTNAALAMFAIIAASWLTRRSNVIALLRWSVAGGAVAAIYGIAQYLGWDPLLPAAAYQAGEGTFTIVRPPGTLGHADYFAPFLLFAGFSAIALWRVEKIPWRRRAAVLATAAAFTALPLTGTRAALVGAVVGGLVLLAATRPRVRPAHLAAAAALCLIAAGFVASPAGKRLRARFHWSLEDRFGGARPLLWRDSMHMAAARPLSGFGPETFILEFPRFQSIELARAYPDFFHESPHNVILDAFVAQGIVGAALLPALWLISALAGVRAFRADPELVAPLLASSAALFVAHQFAVFVPATALVTMLVHAMLVGLNAGGEVAHEGGPPRWVFACAVLAATVLAVHATRLVVSDAALERTRSRITAGDIAAARAAHQVVQRWAPAGGDSELYYSRAMAGAANLSADAPVRSEAWGEALHAGARAAEFSEQRSNAWYSLASLFAAQGDSRAVERCLRNAIAWSPNWFKPHWALAQLLALSNRKGEALLEAGAALDRNGGKNPEVVATWKGLAAAAPR